MRPECSFCRQAAGDHEHNDVLALIDEPWALQPVLAEIGGAVAMPSIGALTPGHLLVCPAAHHRSVLAAPEQTAADIEELVRAARRKLEEATGLPTHVFEHGSAEDGGRIACSVEHAHVHVLPTAVDVRPFIADIASWQPAGKSLDDLRQIAGRSEYLLYEEPGGERIVATTEVGLPSQLLRQVFAAALDVREWNWRVEPAIARMLATAELMGATTSISAGGTDEAAGEAVFA